MPRIYQYSISRSGSTVVWQILKYLFPNSVVSKRHSPPPNGKNIRTVITYRDPRDRVASKWRKQHRNPDRQLKSKQQLKKLLDDNDKHFRGLQTYLETHTSGEHYLLLCYEKFYENFAYLYPRLETFFGITISPEQRQHIEDNFNVHKNMEVAADLKSFHDVHWKTQIHGNHISTRHMGAPGSWHHVIHPDLHKFMLGCVKKQTAYFARLQREEASVDTE